jgi:hypothetical protein
VAPIRIGIAATTAPWSAALRSYVRDHTQGVAVEVVMDRSGLQRALPRLDALVLDDIMRVFSMLDIARAQAFGVNVIGVCDLASGSGRRFLAEMGVDRVVPSSLTPAELVAVACEAAEQSPRARDGATRFLAPLVPAQSPSHGVVSAWTKVSGGAGLTEAVVAAAERLSKTCRVLLVEAEQLAPVLLSRLVRSPEGGLPLALARAAQGLPALPEALSRPRPEGGAGVGSFDVVCAVPGASSAVNGAHFERFLSEAASHYDHVLIEGLWLVGPVSERERYGPARAVLRRAASIVVMAAADPEGAGRLVHWKVAAQATGVEAPAFAVFGRARRGSYVRDHLRSTVEANLGRQAFAGFAFLPEDNRVARARWNAELVWAGPFLDAVADLVAKSVVAGGRVPARSAGRQRLAPFRVGVGRDLVRAGNGAAGAQR